MITIASGADSSNPRNLASVAASACSAIRRALMSVNSTAKPRTIPSLMSGT